MLKDLGTLRTEYASDVNDIANDFYNPCLRESVRYDRVTGFFSSTIFHLTWRSLATFVTENGGRMRLLCSPRLSERDADGLVYGYQSRDDSELRAELHSELQQMLRSDRSDTARLLAALVANNVLDVRIARVAELASAQTKRMFHDKVGLFTDAAGDAVGFRGSMNESYLGLSSIGNIESIDVWPSWEGGRDTERVTNATARFDRIWSGDISGVDVLSLPAEIREELERVAEDLDLDALLKRAMLAADETSTKVPQAVGGIELRHHQCRAVAEWEKRNLHGLLSHATGSGKTITGLYCAQTLVSRGLVPVFLVPSTLLLEQWARQIRELLGFRVILCGGGNTRWARDGLVRAVLEQRGTAAPHAIVAVINTAITPAFRSQVRPVANRVGLIVDEVHRLGSAESRGVMDWFDSPARLGLSATPERANDPVGTQAIFKYFGGIIDRYTLADALEDKVLAPYSYFPTWVSLNQAEQDQWDEITAKIRRLYAMSQGAGGSHEGVGDSLRMKLIERSRIAKGAAAKIPAAAELVADRYRRGQKWLIYCDNQAQMRSVRSSLQDRGIASWEYHSQMAGDPEATLRLFDTSGGIVVAIKCLDEGIDIPSASHALVLSSSRNPREFIQRRGRILRRSPEKTVASLLDVLVLPETADPSDPTLSLTYGELARARQFAEWSISPSSVVRLENKWVELGLPLDQLDKMRVSGIETASGDEDRDE
ncbi:DEAD/DEAH box helicase family protein [Streptomyces smyrnaeus]|uniref:DEAD/DEAH box helicase family protein n=1 Tax=Streptomyces smyrnaeus TaxID=1387713 RepID=UPI00369C8AE1